MPTAADHPAVPAPSEQQLHALAVCLALVAGFIDAVGFMQTGGTFVSFMSGNSTKLAVSVARISVAAVLISVAIGAFFLGAMGGSLIATAAPIRRKPLVLLTVSLCLFAGAVLQAFGWDLAAVIGMALAMGCANTVFRREDGPFNVGITYMTGNLVRLADGLAGLLVGRKRPWLPYLLLWIALLAGAAAGAVLFRLIGMTALWIAAATVALLAFAARNVKSVPPDAKPAAAH